MKWKEFKKKMEKAGVKDKDKIGYIDTCFDFPLKICLSEKGYWNVT